MDTFEYRLIRESEFRNALTRRQPGEQEVVVSARRPGPLSPPQLQGKPRASKVQEGGSATFQARLAGNPPPRITWFKNGARVRPGARVSITEQDSVVSLNLQQVTPQDTGHYTMLAENQAGGVCGQLGLPGGGADRAPVRHPAADDAARRSQVSAGGGGRGRGRGRGRGDRTGSGIETGTRTGQRQDQGMDGIRQEQDRSRSGVTRCLVGFVKSICHLPSHQRVNFGFIRSTKYHGS